jgi:hypothetical protein
VNREADEKREKGTPKKAKLDSRGRPIAVEAPKLDKRADGPTPVRVAVRLGVLLCALSTQSGCEPEAEPLDPRVERAIAEAGEAAKDARAAADVAILAAQTARSSMDTLTRAREREAKALRAP